MSYSRVLLKISGEQLAGRYEFGVDPEIASYLAREVKPVLASGTELVIVVGGGNMVRGAEIAVHGIKRVTGDQMGMLSGLINSMAITDIFEAAGIATRCLSNIYAEQIAESYSYRLANKHLENGRLIIVAGGMGRPYFTHDTAAVNIGLELGCEVVLKATKVDGVFDEDPSKNPAAKKFESLSAVEAVSNPSIQIMDKAAMGLALEHDMPIIVFDALKPGNIHRAATGQAVGTLIKPKD